MGGVAGIRFLADPNRIGNGKTNAGRGRDSATLFQPPAEHRTFYEIRTAAAKEVCRSCPVSTQCRERVPTNPGARGIWDGPIENERAQLLGLRSLWFPHRAPLPPRHHNFTGRRDAPAESCCPGTDPG